MSLKKLDVSAFEVIEKPGNLGYYEPEEDWRYQLIKASYLKINEIIDFIEKETNK